MKRIFARLLVIGGLVLALSPSAAFAQANAQIAGVVKDTSGAVLPGVTVEAASPALIEKTRTAVTDASGQYKIVNLNSGTYTVTFTLAGFSTLKREGVELSGAFAATINGEMKVGALEESITVTGETPVVDVQTVKTQAVLGSEVLAAIPSGRNYENLNILVPGVVVPSGSQDVAGSTGAGLTHFLSHGSDEHDSHVYVNGMSVAAPQQNGGRTMYVPNAGSSQEVTVTTAGGLAEIDTAGVVVNMVYKDGGNKFSGMGFGTAATGWFQGVNYDSGLQAAGLRVPNALKNIYDYEGAFGGPIKKDKLWFYGGSRFHGDTKYVAGMFNNLNAGNPNIWTYSPDLSHQAQNDEYWLNGSGRLTWQATPRNKLAFYYEDAIRCTTCNFGGAANTSPEATAHGATHPDGLTQITWTSPFSNKLLFEAGGSIATERWGSDPRSDYNPALIGVSAQGGSIPGLSYHGNGTLSKSWIATYASRASITYTSGSHSAKFGYNGEAFNYSQNGAKPGGALPLSYRFSTPDAGGVPNLVTEFAWPFVFFEQLNDWGLYAQDVWTIHRLTVGGGVRYDRFTAFFPQSQLGPSLLVPTPLTFAAVQTTALNDITPRINAAYDVFGDGKTAVKVSLGKYLLSQSSEQLPLGGQAAPMNRIPLNFNRAWTDSNHNFAVDCNLTNLAAQNLTASGGDTCGAASNQNFGKQVFSTTQDPSLFYGWGNRPYNWEFDLSVQREIVPRVSVNVGYYRRWFGNFVITDNLAVPASGYNFFNYPVNDPRLPNNGQTVNGFFDINPTYFGQVNNFITKASNFGNETQHWDGLDFAVNARLKDVLMQGGVSTGRGTFDDCQVAAQVPGVLSTSFLPPGVASAGVVAVPMQYCSYAGAWLTQVKLLGSYTVPRIDVQVAGTLQNIPGQDMEASYPAPNAVVAPLLGRSLSGGNANTTLNLLAPLANFSPRVNQLDMRFSKILKFGGTRSQISLDLYNALNSNSIETYNPAYSPTGSWRLATAALPARLAKFSVQFDF